MESLPGDVLARPPEEGLRHLALASLDRLDEALADRREDRASSRLERALEGFDGIVRIWRGLAGGRPGRKVRRIVRELARAVRRTRWLEEAPAPAVPTGEAWTRARRRTAVARKRLHESLERGLPALRSRLETLVVEVRLRATEPHPRLAGKLAPALRDEVGGLQRSLALALEQPGARALEKLARTCRRIQVVLEAIRTPAAVPFDVLDELQHLWTLTDAAGAAWYLENGAIDEAQRDLGTWAESAEPERVARAIEDVADAVAKADLVNVEIERKYLLSSLPTVARDHPSREIRQGWIPGDAIRERLRATVGEGGPRFFRTIKVGEGLRRIELEDETTEEVFAALWPLTEGCRVLKRRYVVPDGDLVWEIDEFLDRDLVLAEVELESEDRDPVVPEWLVPALVRDVTGEGRYVNLNLAR